MKREEKLAKRYFIHKGFESVEFEPDGNIPPDFLLNKEIAVEVRRLNQHWFSNGNSEPLEKLQYNFMARFIGLLDSYKSMAFDKSAFVNVQFSRPLNNPKSVIKEIKRKLDNHLLDIHNISTYQINEEVKIELFPSSIKLDGPFCLGIQTDSNSGGFVVSNICDSLKIVIKEKEKKVFPFRNRYSRWWLALVDYIGYGLSLNDLNQLKESCHLISDFEKIIFIPPLAPEEAVELAK